ncbi:hypothetical protein PR048_026888 [Dryococelus australis]|uniref:Uncharacterized protein n=1 Tax=Dryococelus australis TaxID=614101 RepID=A0ABQ9GML7_9NEOP|nr:hypothetical protein PR048_026888 [Dryococelus australis]
MSVKNYYDGRVQRKPLEHVQGQAGVVQKGHMWEPATILEKHGSLCSYIVKDQSGQVVCRNTKFLRPSCRSDLSKNVISYNCNTAGEIGGREYTEKCRKTKPQIQQESNTESSEVDRNSKSPDFKCFDHEALQTVVRDRRDELHVNVDSEPSECLLCD